MEKKQKSKALLFTNRKVFMKIKKGEKIKSEKRKENLIEEI